MNGDFFSIVITVVFIVSGAVRVATGNMSESFKKKYTPESIRAYAKMFGIMEIIAGLVCGVKYLYETFIGIPGDIKWIVNLIFFAVLIAFILVGGLLPKRKLVLLDEQETAVQTKQATKNEIKTDDYIDEDEDDN